MFYVGKPLSEILKAWSLKCKSDIIAIEFFPSPITIIALNSYTAIRESLGSKETEDIFVGRHQRFTGLLNPNRAG